MSEDRDVGEWTTVPEHWTGKEGGQEAIGWTGENRLLSRVSVQFNCSVVSDSLRPHESQHARPPCPSPTPGVHSDSRPSSQ